MALFSPSPETLVAMFFSVIATLGLTWIFHPAILAAVSDEIGWEEEILGGSNQSELSDGSKILLTIVIPAYNEEERIPIMLSSAHDYLISKEGVDLLKRLQKCSDFSNYRQQHAVPPTKLKIEWIVVNDGSKDGTNNVVRSYHKKYHRDSSTKNPHSDVWRIVNLNVNCGKGAAVKTGMMVANGVYRLMVDADGATDFGPGLECVTDKLQNRLFSGEGKNKFLPLAIFGSRAHLQNEATTRRGLARTLLMYGFHVCVSLLVSSKIKDTQCGFKLFTQNAAVSCFSRLHLRRWAFDTELLILCSYQGIPVEEVDVPWHEVEGSKLNTSKLALAFVSLSMLRDMICVRACYSLRLWKARG